jgi:hypothetical protein
MGPRSHSLLLLLRTGQTEDAAQLHANWTAAWNAFGYIPELFDISMAKRHPMEKGYPLRVRGA